MPAWRSWTQAVLILEEIHLHVRQLGLPIPVRPTAPALLTVLRDAEQHGSGYERHLIGHAAANLDAATWIGQDLEEGRLRLATALDYLTRAAGIAAPEPPARERLSADRATPAMSTLNSGSEYGSCVSRFGHQSREYAFSPTMKGTSVGPLM
ncbi:hypothetical protein [Streptomyces scabiei]|uniref:hypothetical protein n=1 Tax=Streptomyces scabiei TaxID=1930 RepID=UPI00131E924F|nr:hypothetical protein [Streptomyces scabiei]